jgi:hypothetical protein
MNSLSQSFEDRLKEIDDYLELLKALDHQLGIGPPMLGGSPVTGQQQKILYSSVYLQLYNLVEATVTWCIDAISAAAVLNGSWKAGDLSRELQREWVRTHAQTHTDMNHDNRLSKTVWFFSQFKNDPPLALWSIEKGGGGNWDDKEIEDITKRLGCDLNITSPVLSAVKRAIREGKGPLALVKYLRNKLAHGSISFAECGDGITVSDLLDTRNKIVQYLREVIVVFIDYVDNHKFLDPERRP